MNDRCFEIILFIVVFINEFLFFILDIIIIFFSFWSNNILKILFYIYFFFSCVRFIQGFFLYIISKSFKYKIIKFYDIMIGIFFILYIISILFLILELIVITLNYKSLKEFWINCPYIIGDLKYNLHIKRRCELYNINNNSRYSYQYICSYDSSKDFRNHLSLENKSDKVICIQFKELVDNNNIIELFKKEYKKEKKFYCSRTNIPEDYSYAKHSDCNEKKNKFMLAILILPYLRILFIFWPCYMGLIVFDMNTNRRNYFRRNNNVNISRKSTDISETHKKNIIFIKKETKNIIIENKKVYRININIKELEPKTKINNNETFNESNYIEANSENKNFSFISYSKQNKSRTKLNTTVSSY